MGLIKFIKRCRREGFVCGFGWKPSPEKEEFKPARKVNIENLLEKPQPDPEPQIGCIAKSILKDLENPQNWVNEYKYNRVYFTFKTDSKSYTISTKEYKFFNFDGLKEFAFTNDENKALSGAFEKLSGILNDNERKSNLAVEYQILEKLFPECAGKI